MVEGSIRRHGERVRITAQLVSTELGHELWAEHFDQDQREIFAVQDQIVRTIVGTLIGRLHTAGAEQAKRKPPATLVAYECVLRGKVLPIGDAQAEMQKRRMYEKAVELDPGYGRAHALLAHALSLEWFNDRCGSEATLDRALELAKRAVALDENDNICQVMLSWIHLHQKSFHLAELHYQRALELSPNSPEMLAFMGVLHTFLGRSDEAIEWFRQARSIDPYFEPAWYWHILGIAYFIERRYEEAISALSRSATMPVWVRAYLAACHALSGRMDEAQAFTADVLRLKPDFSLNRLAHREPYQRRADYELLVDGLRKAGLPE